MSKEFGVSDFKWQCTPEFWCCASKQPVTEWHFRFEAGLLKQEGVTRTSQYFIVSLD